MSKVVHSNSNYCCWAHALSTAKTLGVGRNFSVQVKKTGVKTKTMRLSRFATQVVQGSYAGGPKVCLKGP